METAHKNEQDLNILITDAGSYLGSELAKAFLAAGAKVYGVGSSSLLTDLLQSHNFTLLELDLSQPLPPYLPKFQKLFYLNLLKDPQTIFSHVPPPLKSLQSISLATEIPLYIVAPISLDPDILMPLVGTEHEKLIKLVQVGDVYGPGLPIKGQPVNDLENLLKQAILSDKIIMEDEGLRIIYPTYISDVIFAISTFAFTKDNPKVARIISEEPKTALSVAYEIQNVASLVLGKSLGLFFSGPEIQNKPEKPHHLHQIGLNFTPKIELAEGIKHTFQDYLGKIKPEKNEEIPRINQILSRIPPGKTIVPGKKIGVFANGPRKLNLTKGKVKFKHLVLFAVFLLFATIAKTVFDVAYAASSLQKARNEFYQGNFTAAIQKSNSAQKSFKAAENKVNIVLFPLLTLNIAFAKDSREVLTASIEASSAAAYFFQGVESLAKDLKGVVSKEKKTEVDIQNVENYFKKAYFLSSLAKQRLSGMNFVFYEKTKIRENISKLNQGALSAYEFSKLYPALVHNPAPRTYLILLQNNTELRPGGGFIGNYGLVEFEAGKLQNFTFDDIYTIDGQLKEEVEPPVQLKEKLGIERFYLRDSNWNLDFNLNSQTARDFFKKETGREVDGVIALDLSFMQKLLEKIGPIKVDDYQEEITAQNLFERGEYYSEVGFFPGSTQKKDFFGALARKIISGMISSLSNASETKSTTWFAFLETALENLETKHFQVSFDDPIISSYLKTKDWDNVLPPLLFDPTFDQTETRDFIALSEANVGANKVNRFLDRELNYEMTIGRDADLFGNLKITYRNNSQAETWPAGKYVNYLRLYLPQEAELISIKNGDITALDSVQVKKVGKLTELATNIEVPVKSTKEVIFTYRIHKNINLEKAPVYHLFVQKQPGTEKDPLRLTFNLPAYLQVKSVNQDTKEAGKENISLQNDLSQDREYTIEIEKK